MDWKNDNLRIWIFRALVVIAGIIIIISFIQPWWICRIDSGGTLAIHGWGLRHNLVSIASYLSEDVTPTWQIVLAWIYVGTSVGLAFCSTWLKKWWSALLLWIIGSGLIAYAAVAANMVIKNRVADYKLPLEGFGTFVLIDQAVNVFNDLTFGYYLAYIAGGAFIILAFVRLLITSKQR